MPEQQERILIVEVEEKALDAPIRRFALNQIFVSATLILIITSIGFFTGRFLDNKYALKRL